jgi:hypothetical protein
MNTACMNKKRLPGYWIIETQYAEDGYPTQVPKYIEDTMSKECRSDFDPHKVGACKGCEYPQDAEYLKEKGLL